jgi:hypothetical protein
MVLLEKFVTSRSHKPLKPGVEFLFGSHDLHGLRLLLGKEARHPQGQGLRYPVDVVRRREPLVYLCFPKSLLYKELDV